MDHKRFVNQVAVGAALAIIAAAPAEVEPCEQAKLLASDGAPSDWPGVSVEVSGDVPVVGAHYDDHNGIDSGSAYVYDMDCLPPRPWDCQASPDGAVSVNDFLQMLVLLPMVF